MSTRKDSGKERLKSLSDLAKYRGEFSAGNEGGTPLIITNQIPKPQIKTERIKDKGYSNLKSAKSKDELFRISMHPKLKSDISYDDAFTNLIERIDSCELCNNIRNIYSSCKRECTENAIPFTLDEEKPGIYGRQRRILDKFEITFDNIEDIHKATYATKFTRDVTINIKRDNPFRVYYKRNGVNIEIVLIDLYHLFATDNLRKFKEVSGYKLCMTRLKD